MSVNKASTNKVLLDTNILIAAIKDNQSTEAQRLRALLSNSQNVVYITPLIYYEVLRGVDWTDIPNYEKHLAILNQLSNLNIDKPIANLAARLFRYERRLRQDNGQTPKKIDKHNFDIMHFATAKQNGLTLASADEDIIAWENLYTTLIATSSE